MFFAYTVHVNQHVILGDRDNCVPCDAVQVVACQDPVAVDPSNSYGMMDEGENETKLCSKAAIVMARTAPEREFLLV